MKIKLTITNAQIKNCFVDSIGGINFNDNSKRGNNRQIVDLATLSKYLLKNN